MMDYKFIEAMAMVIREGGFDKAAEALHITQSAVSQRVKLLEEHTGRILITRTTPPAPTQAGRNLLKHFLKVKQLEDDLKRDMENQTDAHYSSLTVGINADSLATWFPEAVRPFLLKERVLLDLMVDDQDQTLRMLKDGDAVGCISTGDKPLQGCRIHYLGCMNYHLLAAPVFAKKWFPEGLTYDAASSAPAVIFNRKDETHHKLLKEALGKAPPAYPIHYIPSSERFSYFIAMGAGYGMLPVQQSENLVRAGRLKDLAPGYHVPVRLFWHCWNLKSRLLDTLTHQFIQSAETLLDR